MSKKTENKTELIKVKCLKPFSIDGINNVEIGSIVEMTKEEYEGAKQYNLVKKMEE